MNLYEITKKGVLSGVPFDLFCSRGVTPDKRGRVLKADLHLELPDELRKTGRRPVSVTPEMWRTGNIWFIPEKNSKSPFVCALLDWSMGMTVLRERGDQSECLSWTGTRAFYICRPGKTFIACGDIVYRLVKGVLTPETPKNKTAPEPAPACGLQATGVTF